MAPAFTSRARAEEFATLVEGHGAPEGARRRDELVRLAGLVAAMQALPQVQPRAEFSAALREQLMAEADSLAAPAEPTRTPARATPRRRDRRVAALVGGFALVGAGTSVAMAAQTALPGDSLYPIKRVVEGAELTVADDAARGRELLDQAGTRLGEVADLSVRRLPDDGRLVAPTLEAFTDQATDAAELLVAEHARTGEEEPVLLLRDFARESMDQLAALGALVPEDARDELLLAAEAVQAIDSRAGQACPGCAGEVVVVPTELAAAPAEDLVVVAPPEVGPQDEDGTRGGSGGGDVPALPDVRPDELPPGSVNEGTAVPGTDDAPGTPGPADEPVDPVRSLTDELTTRAPSQADTPAPGLGGLLQGATGLAEDTTDGLTDGLDDGLGDLDDELEGTTDGLLGSSD